MPSIESQKLLLASVISGQMEYLGRKFDFWQTEPPQVRTLWQTENPLSLEKALTSINPDTITRQSPRDLAILYGIAWEFIWGQRPPKIVTELRNEIIAKARNGQPLAELERQWHLLMTVDTDIF